MLGVQDGDLCLGHRADIASIPWVSGGVGERRLCFDSIILCIEGRNHECSKLVDLLPKIHELNDWRPENSVGLGSLYMPIPVLLRDLSESAVTCFRETAVFCIILMESAELGTRQSSVPHVTPLCMCNTLVVATRRLPFFARLCRYQLSGSKLLGNGCRIKIGPGTSITASYSFSVVLMIRRSSIWKAGSYIA